MTAPLAIGGRSGDPASGTVGRVTGMAWWQRALAVLRANPSGALLLVQLLGILLYAFVDDTPANSIGRLALSLFGMLVV
ncbi:MAG TPA: hypothetical protein VGK17_11005, partial [Propionicimonas sp.]